MNTIIRLLYDIHRNTSCFFKKTHQTPQLHLPPQEATTSKVAISYDDTRDCYCSGSQGEFNEMTPEFIGKMVYSSITY